MLLRLYDPLKVFLKPKRKRERKMTDTTTDTTTETTTNKNPLTFTLICATVNDQPVFRVSVVIPGLSAAYLVKPEGGNTFPNRSAAIKAAKRRATMLGYDAVIRTGIVAKTKTTTKTTTKATTKTRKAKCKTS